MSSLRPPGGISPARFPPAPCTDMCQVEAPHSGAKATRCRWMRCGIAGHKVRALLNQARLLEPRHRATVRKRAKQACETEFVGMCERAKLRK